MWVFYWLFSRKHDCWMYGITNVSMVVLGGALTAPGNKENLIRNNILRLMVYITIGKGKNTNEFAFYFWYRACIEFQSCCGREYMMNTLMTMLVMLLCLIVFICWISKSSRAICWDLKCIRNTFCNFCGVNSLH